MDISAQQNPPISTQPKDSVNRILSMKNLRRSLGTLVVFLIGFGLGIAIGSGQTEKLLKSSSAIKQSTLLTNAVLTGVNISGRIKTKNPDSLVLENDGQELMVYTSTDTSVFRLPSQGENRSISGALKLSDLSTGMDVTGQVIIKPEGAGLRLNANSLIIKP